MPAISFPTSPTIGQQVSVNGKIYTWSGKVWDSTSSAFYVLNIDDLLDVSVSGVSNGNVLKFNGTSWVPGSAATSLSNLSDVNVSGVTTNNYLRFDGTKWTPSSVTTTTSLSNLTDVVVSGVSTNQILRWNGTKWVPQTASIDFLTDVDTTTTAPAVNNYLRWNGTNWVPTTFPNIPNNINSLTDVDTVTTTPSINNILRWNGTNWVPQTASIDFLTDVDTTSNIPVVDQVLRWSGTNWIPSTISTGAINLDGLSDVTLSSPSDGQILRFSSSTSQWVNSSNTVKETSRYRNRIINGDFKINQRQSYATIQPAASGTKFFVADRWYLQQNTTNAYYQARISLYGNQWLPYSSEVRDHMFLAGRQVTSLSSTELYVMEQDIEAYDLEDINIGFASAKPMTLSFWARSNTAGEYPVSLNIGTSHSFVSSFTITSATVGDASVLQYFTIPVPAFTLASISSFYNSYMMSIAFGMGVGANYRTSTSNSWVAGNYYSNTTSANLTDTSTRQLVISKIQLEKGTSASEFEVISYPDALQRCRRYFFSIDSLNGDNTAIDRLVGDLGTVRSTTTQGTVRVMHPTRMRINPAVTQTGGMTAKDAGTYTSTATLLSQTTREDLSELTFTLGTAGTALRPIYFYANANSGKIEFNAE